MKQILYLSILAVFVFTACDFQEKLTNAESVNVVEANAEKPVKTEKKSIVLVELFTSEGCSSCPPADRNLARLQNEQPLENTEIIALAFHVDYWNYLGWRDKFSSKENSQRQNEYSKTFNLSSNYTPQMIVDGKYEFVGSNWSSALNEISKAAKDEKSKLEISVNETNIKISISNLNLDESSEVFLAITEDDLETNVKRGENSGKKLVHTAVVRDLVKLGDLDKSKKMFTAEKAFELSLEWLKKNLNLVVFVQNIRSKNIVSVGKAKLV